MTDTAPQNGAKTDKNEPKMAVSASFAASEAPSAPETEAAPEEVPGRMLTAVEADLGRMEHLNKGVRGSLAALARELARAMDATGDEQPTPAQVGQLGQQLRTTLLALDNVGGDPGTAEAFFRIMATAVTGDTVSADEPDQPRPRRAMPVSGVEDAK